MKKNPYQTAVLVLALCCMEKNKHRKTPTVDDYRSEQKGLSVSEEKKQRDGGLGANWAPFYFQTLMQWQSIDEER